MSENLKDNSTSLEAQSRQQGNSSGQSKRRRKKKPVVENSIVITANSNRAQQGQEAEVQQTQGSNGQHKKNKQKKPPVKFQSGANAVAIGNSSRKNYSGQKVSTPVNCQDENYGPTESCILCCQPSNVFGVGQCSHPACVECVIRMRCLGGSIVCHFCREDMEKMYFVRMPPNWDDYKLPDCQTNHPDCRKFKICFEDQHTIDIYNESNALTCQICLKHHKFAQFPTFQALKLHMGRDHELFYCHICLNHLNVLPKNRQLFSDKDLSLHINGKVNIVEGINGHPKCKFCLARFFDEEELYKHCRKEHFYCHICSNVTGVNSFFKTSKQLHSHYQFAHYPCMDENCVIAGIVFSNEVDLSLHKADIHATADREIKINFQFSNAQSRYEAPSARISRHLDGNLVAPLPQKPVQNEFPPLPKISEQRKDLKPGKIELGFRIGGQERFAKPSSRIVRSSLPPVNNQVKDASVAFKMNHAQSRPNELQISKDADLKNKSTVESIETNESSIKPNSKEWWRNQLMLKYSKR